MSSTDCAEQKGIIEEITNGMAKVNITSYSACSSCQSKSACSMNESSSKIIDVFVDTEDYKVGEMVKVAIKKSLGMRATLLAYVIPFMIIIASLIVFKSLGLHEGLAGLISLSLLIPYYLGLYLLNNTLKKTFQFTLNKVS